jgi:recombination associated protein RdgC
LNAAAVSVSSRQALLSFDSLVLPCAARYINTHPIVITSQEQRKMWFKNIYFYRFTKPFNPTSDELDTKLSEAAFTPCGPQDTTKAGWVPPLGRHGTQYVHETNGYQMISLNREDKILPASVIKDIVQEKVQEIEDTQMRKVGRKERDELKDQVMNELLPQAFRRSSTTFGYVAATDGFLIVNAGSPKKADDFSSTLRQAMGSLPIRMPAVRQSPSDVMTEWLKGTRPLPARFELQDECELREPGESGGIVRCKGCDLQSDEFRMHLEAGKRVVKLALSWDEKISFVMGEDLTVKRLRFSDVLQDAAQDAGAEDAAAHFDADFAILAAELARLIPEILEAFGGEDDSALIKAA